MADTESGRKEPERVTATEAYKRLAEMMDRAQFGGARFIIERHGQDAVVIMAAGEFKRLEALGAEVAA